MVLMGGGGGDLMMSGGGGGDLMGGDGDLLEFGAPAAAPMMGGSDLLGASAPAAASAAGGGGDLLGMFDAPSAGAPVDLAADGGYEDFSMGKKKSGGMGGFGKKFGSLKPTSAADKKKAARAAFLDASQGDGHFL